jgi:hypothetical protein
MNTTKNYYIQIQLKNYQDNDLDVRILNQYHDDLKIIIDTFNQEHEWDKMYTIGDCHTRFKEGLFCMVWYDNDNPIGISWYCPIGNYTYCHNIFVSQKRPSGYTSKFLSKNHFIMKEMGFSSTVLYVDDWNIKMKKVIHKLVDVNYLEKEEFDKLTESVKKYTYI